MTAARARVNMTRINPTGYYGDWAYKQREKVARWGNDMYRTYGTPMAGNWVGIMLGDTGGDENHKQAGGAWLVRLAHSMIDARIRRSVFDHQFKEEHRDEITASLRQHRKSLGRMTFATISEKLRRSDAVDPAEKAEILHDLEAAMLGDTDDTDTLIPKVLEIKRRLEQALINPVKKPRVHIPMDGSSAPKEVW